MLLSYYLPIGRETIDIDILARRLNAEKSNVELIMQNICLLNMDDGFQMQFINLDDLEHQHMNYPGFRVGIAVQFGVMSDKFFVDIGVGDAVEPVLLNWPSFSYKDIPLFSDSISLKVYPVQFQSDDLERMQLLWAAHLRALGALRTQTLGLPQEIETVINDLNQWLLTI